MALLKKNAGGICDFCHKAWKGKDYLVYLRWKGGDGVAGRGDNNE